MPPATFSPILSLPRFLVPNSQQGPAVRAKPRPRGFLTASFALGYGLARFMVEFTRQPDAFLGYLWFGLSMGQLLSIPLIVIGAGMLIWSVRKSR